MNSKLAYRSFCLLPYCFKAKQMYKMEIIELSPYCYHRRVVITFMRFQNLFYRFLEPFAVYMHAKLVVSCIFNALPFFSFGFSCPIPNDVIFVFCTQHLDCSHCQPFLISVVQNKCLYFGALMPFMSLTRVNCIWAVLYRSHSNYQMLLLPPTCSIIEAKPK